MKGARCENHIGGQRFPLRRRFPTFFFYSRDPLSQCVASCGHFLRRLFHLKEIQKEEEEEEEEVFHKKKKENKRKSEYKSEKNPLLFSFLIPYDPSDLPSDSSVGPDPQIAAVC